MTLLVEFIPLFDTPDAVHVTILHNFRAHARITLRMQRKAIAKGPTQTQQNQNQICIHSLSPHSEVLAGLCKSSNWTPFCWEQKGVFIILFRVGKQWLKPMSITSQSWLTIANYRFLTYTNLHTKGKGWFVARDLFIIVVCFMHLNFQPPWGAPPTSTLTPQDPTSLLSHLAEASPTYFTAALANSLSLPYST